MPQELATTEQQTTAPIQKPTRERRVPKRIAQAIELLVTGECTTQKAAALRVGLNPQWLCKALAKDNARVFYARRVRQTIAGGAAPAAARLIGLIHAGSEHVSADVSKYLLAIEGIKPQQDASVSVNIELKAGYVIDLTGRKPRAEQIIEQNQIEALPTVGRDGADD
jgi:hypothetical protein